MESLKKQSNWIYFLFLAVATVLYTALFVINTPAMTGDMRIYYSLIKKFADPTLYTSQDLIITSGELIPFNFYRLGAFLYRWNPENFFLYWYAAFQLILVLTSVTIFLVFGEILKCRKLALLTTIFVLVSEPKLGALNWTFVPLFSMVSRTPAQLLVFLSLLFFLRGQGLKATLVSGACFSIHPGYSLISFSHILFWEFRTLNFKNIIYYGTVFSLLGMPTLYQLLSVSKPFEVQSIVGFFDIFPTYSFHAYFGNHLYEGVGACIFLAIIFFHVAKSLESELSNRLCSIFFCTLAIISFYAINLYFVESVFVTKMFLYRATIVTKILFFSCLVIYLLKLTEKRGVVGLAAISLLFFYLSQGFSSSIFPRWLIEFSLGYFALTTIKRRSVLLSFVALHVALLLLLTSYSNLSVFKLACYANIFIGVSTLISILFFKYKSSFELPQLPSVNWIMSGLLALLMSVLSGYRIDPHTNFRFFQIDNVSEEAQGFVEWIKTNSKKEDLFAIPPGIVSPWALSFRHWTERSLYITLDDINQLAYFTPAYIEGHQRLLGLGMKTVSRREFDSSEFYKKSAKTLRALMDEKNIDYFVMEQSQYKKTSSKCRPVYFDEAFVILSKMSC